MAEEKIIITHSGTFHADEALACFLLSNLPEYKNAKIIRTRDPDVIDKGDIVVDVGAIYDVSKNRFDHHQRGFEEVMSKDYSIKLSSAGLIYKHFGRKVIQNIFPEAKEDVIEILFWKIYKALICEIDAIDNGVNQFDGISTYKINTNLSARVGRLNPSWNCESSDEIRLNLFKKAIKMTGEEFMSISQNIYKSWYPARNIVEQAVNSKNKIHESGRIIELKQFCPWSSHLFDIEKEQQLGEDIYYVIFPDSSNGWRVQAVPKTPGSFENRKPLPEPWRGKRDEELSNETGIPGCVFIHASGFIGGHTTKDGALALAIKALSF